MEPDPLISLEVALPLIKWLSIISVVLGVFHLVVYIIGEFSPGAYKRISSDGFRKILVGTGNRLMWGCGGLFMLVVGIIGFGGLWLIKLLERLNNGGL